MAEPGQQVQGIPQPPQPPAQVQVGPQVPQQQEHHAPPAQQGQHVIHLTGLILSQKSQENLMRMQKPICFTPMTG